MTNRIDIPDKTKILEKFKENWFATMNETANWQKTEGKKATAIKDATASTQEATASKVVPIITNFKMTPLPISPTYVQATKKFRPENKEIKQKNWYNINIKNFNPYIYEAFSSLHSIAITSQIRPIDFHLSALEKAIINEINIRDERIKKLEERIQEQEKAYITARQSAENMTKFCQLEISEAWYQRIEEIDTIEIKELLNDLNIPDQIRIRTKDFGAFLSVFKNKSQIAEKIKKEVQVQELIDLYYQNLASPKIVIELLTELKKDPIEHYFLNESNLTLINNHPSFLVAPGDILIYSEHFKKGIVREAYFLLESLQHYNHILPNLMQKHFSEIRSQYQILLKVEIFSIWEERHELQLFPTRQLWLVQWATCPPDYPQICTSKIKVDINEERIYNSYLFFKNLEELYDQVTYVEYSNPIILYSKIYKGSKEKTKNDFTKMVLWDAEENLGSSAKEGMSQYYNQEVLWKGSKISQNHDQKEAMVDPTKEKLEIEGSE